MPKSLQETLRSLWTGVEWSNKAETPNVAYGVPVGFLTTIKVTALDDEFLIEVTAYRMTVGYYRGPNLAEGVEVVARSIREAAATTHKACKTWAVS